MGNGANEHPYLAGVGRANNAGNVGNANNVCGVASTSDNSTSGGHPIAIFRKSQFA